MSHQPYHILLTIDVEDWFQVENLKECIPFSTWSSYELRVEKNTHRILDLLDSIEIQRSEIRGQGSEAGMVDTKVGTEYPVSSIKHQASSRPKATFFVLGWIAERLPGLVREIHSRGHEVASHGYCHNLCKYQSKSHLTKDLIDSKKLLEDTLGIQVFGYRAPSFSIDDEILRLIENAGYIYDSSFNSFGLNNRYGHIDLSQNEKKGIASKLSDSFYELAISNLKFKNFTLPWGGGGYLRLLPFTVFEQGIRLILKKESAYLFYIHPWEIDPEQPKVRVAKYLDGFKHRVNLNRTYNKFFRFLVTCSHYSFTPCREYLEKVALKAVQQ